MISYLISAMAERYIDIYMARAGRVLAILPAYPDGDSIACVEMGAVLNL